MPKWFTGMLAELSFLGFKRASDLQVEKISGCKLQSPGSLGRQARDGKGQPRWNVTSGRNARETRSPKTSNQTSLPSLPISTDLLCWYLYPRATCWKERMRRRSSDIHWDTMTSPLSYRALRSCTVANPANQLRTTPRLQFNSNSAISANWGKRVSCRFSAKSIPPTNATSQ